MMATLKYIWNLLINTAQSANIKPSREPSNTRHRLINKKVLKLKSPRKNHFHSELMIRYGVRRETKADCHTDGQIDVQYIIVK